VFTDSSVSRATFQQVSKAPLASHLTNVMIRVRYAGGVTTFRTTPNTTMSELQEHMKNSTGIPPAEQRCMCVR